MTERQGKIVVVLAWCSVVAWAFGQILASWVAIGWTWHRRGALTSVLVGAGTGVLGWWFLFRWIRPRLATFSEKRFGPQGMPLSFHWEPGAGARYGYSSAAFRAWLQIAYACAIVAPLVQLLLGRP